VGADGAALIQGSSEWAHKRTSRVRPAALIPLARTEVLFERAGARRRRSWARPAVDPADEEGGDDRTCWGGWIASSDPMRGENGGEGRRI
jgi:hypothetical protein